MSGLQKALPIHCGVFLDLIESARTRKVTQLLVMELKFYGFPLFVPNINWLEITFLSTIFSPLYVCCEGEWSMIHQTISQNLPAYFVINLIYSNLYASQVAPTFDHPNSGSHIACKIIVDIQLINLDPYKRSYPQQ